MNDSIAIHLKKLHKRIIDAARDCGRNPEEITLIAASKTQDVSRIKAAIAAGQSHFGENYVQEAINKMAKLADPGVIWHFIGPIQSNKAKLIAENFSWVHSVDRLKIAEKLNLAREQNQQALNVLIQVNTSGEESKSGVAPQQVPKLVKQIQQLPNLRLRGLMTIPAASDDIEQQQVPFKQLKQLINELNQQGIELESLSMGMSKDLEAAIYQGATMVRIGTDIFGPREYNSGNS